MINLFKDLPYFGIQGSLQNDVLLGFTYWKTEEEAVIEFHFLIFVLTVFWLRDEPDDFEEAI